MYPNMSKILILHDYFLYKGGGERLVISLAKGLKADVATAFIAKDAFDPRAEGIPTRELFRETWLSKLPGFRYLQVQTAFLFKAGFVKEYDVVIYSGDCLMAYARTAPGTTNIAYMHTPPRHIYDSYRDRLREYSWIKKIIFVPFAAVNRWRFGWLAKKMDLIVTNSKNTQARIKQYLGLESVVVYPPCDILKKLRTVILNESASRRSSEESPNISGDPSLRREPSLRMTTGWYFFSWARLYPVKRVDLIVEAFKKLSDKKLIVASGGPELERLRKLAEGFSNIKILGWISDAELLEYLGKCLATIYIPIREDFGMSPVESMAVGKPVIGVAEGGMLEVIVDGVNGVMLKPEFNVDDLVAAINSMTPERARAMESACYETGKRFTEGRFLREMDDVIKKIIGNKK